MTTIFFSTRDQVIPNSLSGFFQAHGISMFVQKFIDGISKELKIMLFYKKVQLTKYSFYKSKLNYEKAVLNNIKLGHNFWNTVMGGKYCGSYRKT